MLAFCSAWLVLNFRKPKGSKFNMVGELDDPPRGHLLLCLSYQWPLGMCGYDIDGKGNGNALPRSQCSPLTCGACFFPAVRRPW